MVQAEDLTLAMLDEVTTQLERLYQSRQHYPFIEQAHRVLSVRPTAPDLARLTLQTLIELGLGGPALELLQFRRDLYVDEDERARLQMSIAKQPNGRVPWTRQTPIFRRNLTALLGCRPALDAWAHTLPELLGPVHLHQSRQGHNLLSRRKAGMLREWLTDLSTREREPTVQLPSRGQLGPTAVVGLRVGNVLERIYEDTHRLALTYSHPIYLIEPDPVCFSAALHCADLTRLFADDRVYVFVGEDAVDQFHAALTSECDLPAPTNLVNLGGSHSPFDDLKDACRRITTHREEEYKRRAAAI